MNQIEQLMQRYGAYYRDEGDKGISIEREGIYLWVTDTVIDNETGAAEYVTHQLAISPFGLLPSLVVFKETDEDA